MAKKSKPMVVANVIPKGGDETWWVMSSCGKIIDSFPTAPQAHARAVEVASTAYPDERYFVVRKEVEYIPPKKDPPKPLKDEEVVDDEWDGTSYKPPYLRLFEEAKRRNLRVYPHAPWKSLVRLGWAIQDDRGESKYCINMVGSNILKKLDGR